MSGFSTKIFVVINTRDEEKLQSMNFTKFEFLYEDSNIIYPHFYKKHKKCNAQTGFQN